MSTQPSRENRDDRSKPGPAIYLNSGDWQVQLLGVSLVGLTLIAILIFGQFFFTHIPPASAEDANPTADLPFLFWTIANVSAEVRLLLLVIISGALGGLTRALGSFAQYVGHRVFISSWITHYYFQPFIGATLGLVFYLVIRGGFFAPGTTTEEISELGFIALGALVGLFNGQAMEKLQDIAAAVFKSSKGTKEHLPDDETEPENEQANGSE